MSFRSGLGLAAKVTGSVIRFDAAQKRRCCGGALARRCPPEPQLIRASSGFDLRRNRTESVADESSPSEGDAPTWIIRSHDLPAWASPHLQLPVDFPED